eukprot:evm.model.scf_1577.2 EVM.evm.TU.scf_1577.2   scf_1577:14115-14645(-)
MSLDVALQELEVAQHVLAMLGDILSHERPSVVVVLHGALSVAQESGGVTGNSCSTYCSCANDRNQPQMADTLIKARWQSSNDVSKFQLLFHGHQHSQCICKCQSSAIQKWQDCVVQIVEYTVTEYSADCMSIVWFPLDWEWESSDSPSRLLEIVARAISNSPYQQVGPPQAMAHTV